MSELATNCLLPALPDDLALLCLARLSRRTLALCRCVSRALRDSLHPRNSTLKAIRLQLGNRHEFGCLFLCVGGMDDEYYFFSEEDVEWLLLDLAHRRCEVLPSPVLPSSPDNEMLGQSVQAMHAHGKVLLNGVSYYSKTKPDVTTHSSLGFDVAERRWYFDVQPTIQNDRVEFAWAKTGDYLYVAGGRPGEIYSPPHKSAERFNFVTQRWETLPDMKEARQVCTGFVMDGCFYVIGGFQTEIEDRCSDSAEFFDPRTNCWMLVPGMWPREIAAMDGIHEAPNVAVVKEELYALKFSSTEVLWYDKLRSRWIKVGELPEELVPWNGHLHRLVSVGDDELWVLLRAYQVPLSVVSCKPSGGRSVLTWKILPLDIPERLRNMEIITSVHVDDV